MEKKAIQDEIFIKLIKHNGEYRIGEFAGSNATETEEMIVEINRSVRMCKKNIKEREMILHNIKEEAPNNPMCKGEKIRQFFKNLNESIVSIDDMQWGSPCKRETNLTHITMLYCDIVPRLMSRNQFDLMVKRGVIKRVRRGSKDVQGVYLVPE